MLRRSSSLFLLVLCACDPGRPSDAFEPKDLDRKDIDDDAAADEAGPPADGGPVIVMPEAGVDQTPLERLQATLSGDYFLRMDTTSNASSLGITVRSDVATYSLVKVGFTPEGKFTFVDQQCYVDIVQDANTSTTLRDEGQRANAPARRELSIDEVTGAWTTSPCAYAVGWNWDYATQPDREPPMSDTDPLIKNPDGGGPGLDLTVKSGLGPAAITCRLNVAQKIDVSLSGSLSGSMFSSGVVTAGNSVQTILSQSCTTPAPKSDSTGPDTLRLVRAPTPVDASFTCPAKATFQAAF